MQSVTVESKELVMSLKGEEGVLEDLIWVLGQKNKKVYQKKKKKTKDRKALLHSRGLDTASDF